MLHLSRCQSWSSGSSGGSIAGIEATAPCLHSLLPARCHVIAQLPAAPTQRRAQRHLVGLGFGKLPLTFEIEGGDATNVDFEDYTDPREGLQMEMFNPPHPGEIIREDCLKPLDLSVTAAAKWLGVSRVTLSQLLNGHNGVTAEIAIRLEKAGWGSAESWLRNQLSYDLWHAKKRAAKIKVKKFPSPELA